MNVEDLVRAAQVVDGDLPAGAAAPELVERIRRVDALAAALAVDLPADHLDRLVAGAGRRRRRWWPIFAAAGGVAAAVVLAFLLRAPPPDPIVRLDVPGGTVTLAAGSRFEVGPPPSLIAGVLLASGEVAIAAGRVRIEGSGEVLVAREPPGDLDRVIPQMPIDWKKLASPALGAAAGVVVTVAVLQGHALVFTPGASPARLEAGQRWTEPLISRPGQLPAGTPQDVAALERGAEQPDDPATVAELRQRLATVEQERESLLRERTHLRSQVAGAQPTVPLHHIPQEELLRMAADGELDLRLPHIGGGELEYSEDAASALKLTPAEREGIRRIYHDSFERIRGTLSDLYVEIGGDRDFAAGASINTLFNEIQQKALPGDHIAAVREIAKERAGVAQPTPGGPAILRATRLAQQEDDGVVAELDALLGSDRAGRLLEDPGTSHSVWVSRHHQEP